MEGRIGLEEIGGKGLQRYLSIVYRRTDGLNWAHRMNEKDLKIRSSRLTYLYQTSKMPHTPY